VTTRRKLSDVNDGYITGRVEQKGYECGHCGMPTRVIRIDGLKLQKEIYYSPMGNSEKERKNRLKRFIFCDDNGSALNYIGIGCGCYAKAHRQIAHIVDNVRSRQS
jgi:hypothetical protein